MALEFVGFVMSEFECVTKQFLAFKESPRQTQVGTKC
jgi:hypothetical protein